MTARPLFKLDADQKIRRLERMLANERRLRKEAEENTRKFHALLIAERIKHLPARVT